MKSVFLFSVCLLLACAGLSQQIRYDLSAPNLAHHEAEITLTATGLKPGPAVFRMSRSSPGRYATHEFGKNVYNVKAVDANGKSLPVEKLEGDVYRVANQNGTVKLSYTLYGNYADGTYAEIDPMHFHLNMPATFMWVKGYDQAPITLHLNLPDPSWTTATQLKPTSDPAIFTAPGLQYFMDSPTKAGDLHLRQWTVTNPNGKAYTFRLALEADAKEAAVDTLAQQAQRVVQEAKAVYGEVPAYDFGTYTFISSINPYVKGDGMEHRNSTMITIPRPFSTIDNLPGVFAHEFFHNWNVERIRPKSIEPFNFEKANMSEALWIAEGFTQYYGMLLMKRAGLVSDEDFFQQLSGLIAAKEMTPGAKYYTPVENSQRAVFVDAGVSIDRTNYPNMFTSYYYYGGALALALDLQLREKFGKSLDVFMQELWKRFGKTEKAYTLPEVQAALAAVSSPQFAADFFRRHVYGHEAIDYNSMVQAAGLQLKKTAEGTAWIGNDRFVTENGNLIVARNTIRETPLYEAGVDAGDVLLSLDGKTLKAPDDVAAIVKQHQPGDQLKLTYSHRNTEKETTVTLQQDPEMALVPNGSATAAQQAFRSQWYGSHAH